MVATVVNLTSASSTVHYFRRDGYGTGGDGPGAEGAGYYADKADEHRKASRWRGAGAGVLGLTGHVEPEAFRRVLQGHVPGTELRLGRIRDGAHEHRAGVDITLSAPKSVSLEALVPGRGNARARRAHDAAVRDTLGFIEDRLLKTRRWDSTRGRSVRVDAAHLVAATFRHITSRNNDPQLHTHCVVANMTRGGDGRWRSAEVGLLRRSERLIGAYYRNALAGRLRRAGFALRPSMIGAVPGFEIAGWPQAALSAFSSRRREVLDFIAERGWRYDARSAQAATLATRRRKREPRRAELEALWSAFARERGLAKENHRRRIGVRAPEPLSALEIAWRAVAQAEERAAVFPRERALAAALAHSPGVHDFETLEAAFAALMRDGHLLPAIRRGVGPAWTTRRAVEAEREVLMRLREGQSQAAPLLPAPVPEAALEGLSAGQRAAARLILESADRTVGVQGYAGTGKTAMLRAVAGALTKERRLVGLAPSASAARTLARETGLGCRTLQWFLARTREVADGVADAETLEALKHHYAGAVLVIDEASLMGTAQARALLRVAARLEVARLVLVGDARQLRGVEAGQPFGQLQRAGMATAVLDEVRRQRDPDLRAAVQDLIEGEPGEALGRLGDHLHEAPPEALAPTAAALWLRLSPEARAGTALLVPTRAMRAAVNAAVREGLEAEGALAGPAVTLDTLVPLGLTRAETGDARNWREGDVALFHNDLYRYRIAAGDACTVTEVGEDRVGLAHPDGRPRHLVPGGDIRYRLSLHERRRLHIREGERLRFTRNDPVRGLVNGEEVEVRTVAKTGFVMRSAGGRDLALALDDPQLRHVAYAYASTVHGAQGQTHERVVAVLDAGAGPLVNQQTLYVQLSRAREQAVVLTDHAEQLLESLEANTGERMTALEAIGEPVVPEKAPVKARAAEAFVARVREAREREVAAVQERARVQALDTWLAEAERFLAAAPPAAVDGYAREDWRGRLERLATQGRSVLREARGSPHLDTPTAVRVREASAGLERMFRDERTAAAERGAVDRARDWTAAWRGAADPEDPFAARSDAATVETGRRIATEPALPEPWRRAVTELLDGHAVRTQALPAARSWLYAWARFEREHPDRHAAFDAPEAPVRIARARALIEAPGLPRGLERALAAVVAGYDVHRARVARWGTPRMPASEVERQGEARRLDAVRSAARREAAEALEAADRLRRGLDAHPRDGETLEATVERCEALADAAGTLEPRLPPAEAVGLARALSGALERLRERIDGARHRLRAVRERLERARVHRRLAALRAGWDAHRRSHAFHPEDAERHREWIEALRELVDDPHLEPVRRGELVGLLDDYDRDWPERRARCVEAVADWNALAGGASGGGVGETPEYDSVIEELRAVAGLDTLSVRERDAIHEVLREHRAHRRRTRHWSRGLSM